MPRPVVYPTNGTAPPDLAPKDPDAVITYTIDWRDWLNGETIQSSSWILPEDPGSIESDGDSISGGNQFTTIALSGGTPGKRYLITNRIATDTRVEDRSFYVRVVDR